MKYKICVIGLGYVGLPLAVEFSKKYKTVGYDINKKRIEDLRNNFDETGEVEMDDLKSSNINFTCSLEKEIDCNTYIVTVPTPIDSSKKPDLKALKSASKIVGEVIKQGDLVIFESTVYPGCTMQDCIPIIEKNSDLKVNVDFYCGYSPERINPGDKERVLTSITKIVSGSNKKALELVDDLYSSILILAKTYKVSSIEVAEAAKIIENTQRDLNIAFINELALIFEKLELDTNEVINAAATKWNFMPFKPGLVGGHCIGVDPYYLTYKSNLLGYSPEVILSGRKLNDNMGNYIAQRVVKKMISKSIIIENSSVLVLGFTFKENCPDIRNTKVVDIVKELKQYKVDVSIYDPWVDSKNAEDEYGVQINSLYKNKKYDAVILAVAHKQFLNIELDSILKEKFVIFDIKSFLPQSKELDIVRL